MYWFLAGMIVGFVLGVLFARKNRKKVEAYLATVMDERNRLAAAINAKLEKKG